MTVFDIVILAHRIRRAEVDLLRFQETSPRLWCNFLDDVKTTQTAALQLWLKRSTEELDWPDPETALTGFERPGDKWQAAPLSSWEDNTRLLHLERDAGWRSREALPISAAFFRTPIPFPIPERTRDFLRRSSRERERRSSPG